jgi:hypothetical protein
MNESIAMNDFKTVEVTYKSRRAGIVQFILSDLNSKIDWVSIPIVETVQTALDSNLSFKCTVSMFGAHKVNELHFNDFRIDIDEPDGRNTTVDFSIQSNPVFKIMN